MDAFLRGMVPETAPDFAEFESIYAQQQPRLFPPPGAAALPPALEAQGRAAAAPVLQASTLLGPLHVEPSAASTYCCCCSQPLRSWPSRAALHTAPCKAYSCRTAPCACRLQAFVDSSKAHAPFQPALAPPGLALSLADQRRVRDRGTIMARQLFAEQGTEFAGGRGAAAGGLRLSGGAVGG